MGEKHILVIFLLALSLLNYKCGTQKPLASIKQIDEPKNYSDQNILKTKLYHISDSRTEFHLAINGETALFRRKNDEDKLEANLAIRLLISPNDGSAKTDTVKYEISGEALEEQFSIYHVKTIDLANRKNYTIDVHITDLNRNTRFHKTLRANKTSDVCSENFILFNTVNALPEFNSFLTVSSDYKVKSKRVNLSQITAYHGSPELNLPPPPYSNSKAQNPDTTIYSVLTSDNTTNEISLTDVKIGNILLKNERDEGMSFLVRPDHFPLISQTSAMVEPLRYICARKEFERINAGANLKEGLDKFWINCGDSKERAKELISIYYNRVELANTYFSSFKDGWRTDRGLIFIVFGPPTEVINIGDDEKWLYGHKNDIGSIEFRFMHKQNELSSNHFELERESIYKSEWAKRVGSWRNGRIF